MGGGSIYRLTFPSRRLRSGWECGIDRPPLPPNNSACGWQHLTIGLIEVGHTQFRRALDGYRSWPTFLLCNSPLAHLTFDVCRPMRVSDAKRVHTVNPVMLLTTDLAVLPFPTQNQWLGLLGSTSDQERTKINSRTRILGFAESSIRAWKRQIRWTISYMSLQLYLCSTQVCYLGHKYQYQLFSQIYQILRMHRKMCLQILKTTRNWFYWYDFIQKTHHEMYCNILSFVHCHCQRHCTWQRRPQDLAMEENIFLVNGE